MRYTPAFRFHWHFPVLWLAFWFLAIPLSARAQLPPQPQGERARIFLQTEGPSATIWQLAFSPDSRVLYAAGNDKVVHRWLLPDEKQAFPPRYLTPLRWPFSRGNRGSIYAMAVPPNPQSTEIAIAGLSAYGGHEETLTFLWDASREDIVSINTHPELTRSVVAMDFAPGLKDKRLLVRSVGGNLNIVDLETGQRTSLRVPQQVETSQPAIFVDSRSVAVAIPHPTKPGLWDLAAYDVNDPNRQQGTFSAAVDMVTALARQPGGSLWASAERRSNGAAIHIWNGANPRQVPKVLPINRAHVPYSLSFSGPESGLLAVALEENVAGEVRKTVVQLYDVRAANQGRLTLIAETGLGENQEKLPKGERFACALSRDGRWLAAAGSRTPGVTIFRVEGKDLTPVRVPDSGKTAWKGNGQTPWEVAWAQNAKPPRLGISFEKSKDNAPNRAGGPIQHEFDFEQLDLNAQPAGFAGQWNHPDLEHWQVQVDSADDSGGERKYDIVSVTHARQTTSIDLLDPSTNESLGTVRSYCLIPNPHGPEMAIAIGTDDQNGIFLYELPQGNGKANLIRYFRDHSGPVHSLSVSSDGRFLASASEDQTVKVWSLARLFHRQREQQVWGCEFGISANNEVVVQNSLPGSIAARRGLVAGATVEKFWTNGKWFDQPGTIIPALESIPVTQQLYAVYRTPQNRQEAVIVVPAWEPLVTLFVRERGRKDWALFTPEGYFDCSLASGNELFGFQVLQKDKTPINLKASEMQKEFRQRGVMQKLLSAGSLEKAMSKALGPRQLEEREPLILLSGEYARRQPLVQVSYENQQPEKGDLFGIQVKVEYPKGKTREDFEVQAFLNGALVLEESRKGVGHQEQLLYKEEARNPLNRFKLIVSEIKEAGETREIVRYLPTRGVFPTPGQFNLYAMALAADDYNQGFPGPLNSPVRDAKSFLGILSEKSQNRPGRKPFFNLKRSVSLFNEHLSLADFDQELGDLKGRARGIRPDDLLVVLLVGHGDIAPGTKNYYFLPSTVTSPADIEVEGFSWDRLEPLTELPCRKLFIIDTCHAGQALYSLTDELKKRDCLVMCSSAANQPAAETNFSQDPDMPDWHMYYLHYLNRGLKEGTADLSQDGEISLWECVQSLEDYDDLPSHAFHQPRDLFQVLDIPLAYKDLAE